MTIRFYERSGGNYRNGCNVETKSGPNLSYYWNTRSHRSVCCRSIGDDDYFKYFFTRVFMNYFRNKRLERS